MNSAIALLADHESQRVRCAEDTLEKSSGFGYKYLPTTLPNHRTSMARLILLALPPVSTQHFQPRHLFSNGGTSREVLNDTKQFCSTYALKRVYSL